MHQGGGSGAPVSLAGPGASAPSTRTPPAADPRGKLLVVDVEGEVRQPGIQRVPDGARAAAAVSRAGGLTRRGDATAVNLAAPLHDGQQVVVPRRGAAGAPGARGVPAAPTAAGGAPGALAQPVSLSSATVAQLDTLDGI